MKKLTRDECEKKIMQKLHEIVDIYHQFDPDGNYLNLLYWADDNASDGKDFFSFNSYPLKENEISAHEFVDLKRGTKQ